MNNQNNNQTTNNQTVGGNNNMDIMQQLGTLFGQLNNEQLDQMTMSVLGTVAANPERDSILARAGLVQPQVNNNGGVNMNNNNSNNTMVNNNGNYELSPETFNTMMQQMSSMQAQIAQLTQTTNPIQQPVNTQQQAPVQQPMQYTTIDATTLARLQEIELALVERTNMYNNYVQWGFNTYPVLADIERLKKEHATISGSGLKNQVVNGLGSIADYGQNKVANEFIPNVVNTTSSVLADGLNIIADLVTSVGGIAVNTTAQVIQTGANAVGQVGTVASNASQTYANSAFGLFRK